MKEPVYFLKLVLENVRCFGSKAILDLSDGNGNWKKWTIILGDNGLGKTTLLQCLAGMENDDKNAKNIDSQYVRPKLGRILRGRSIEFKSKNERSGRPATLYAHVSVNNKYSEEIYISIHSSGYATRSVPSLPPFYCFGYGANRVMSLSALSDNKSENSDTLYSEDARLINAEEWLLQLDYVASKDSEVQSFAAKRRDQVKQILIELLPDVEDLQFTTPTKENLKSSIEFKIPFGWIGIHQLSLGYKTMVAWMVDLAARMFDHYPESDNPLGESAIVLVDEIDLHLHPKWQRKIFDYLSDRFPQTQFVVTAHSPLVVQSAPKDANIVLLRREEDHVVIDNDVHSVQNWRLDQIMTSDLFGLESARGNEVEKKLTERKALLSKEQLSKQEKERLDELNSFIRKLPTAESEEDMEAMSIVREAAEFLKSKGK